MREKVYGPVELDTSMREVYGPVEVRHSGDGGLRPCGVRQR